MTKWVYTKYTDGDKVNLFRYYPEVYFRLSTEKDGYVSYQFYYGNEWCPEIGSVRLLLEEEVISEDEVNKMLVQMELEK